MWLRSNVRDCNTGESSVKGALWISLSNRSEITGTYFSKMGLVNSEGKRDNASTLSKHSFEDSVMF